MNTVEPAKKVKIRVASRPVGAPSTAKGIVVTEKLGVVSTFDKIKYYYKWLISAVGGLIIILNQVTPVFDFLDGDAKKAFTVIVAILTSVGVFLKENEKWVNKLPGTTPPAV